MKKLMAILLTLVLVAGLFACAKPAPAAPAPAEEAPVAEAPAAAEPETETAAEEAAGFDPAGRDTISINVTTTQNANQLLGEAAAMFETMAEEYFKGLVEVNVYAGASLYTSSEEIDALSKNDVQIIFCPGTNLASVDPAMGVFKLPFLFPSLDVAYEVLDDAEISEAIFQNIEHFKVLGALTMGSCYISNNVRAIASPEDMQGLTLRSPGKIEAGIIEACGASAVTIDNSETYTALQQGVVDGLATPSLAYMQRQYFQVTKYCTDSGMLFWPVSFVIANDTFWSELDDDVRAGMEEIFGELIPTLRQMGAEDMTQAKKTIEEAGVEFYTLSDADVAVWAAATASVYDKQREAIGADVIAAVQDKVAKVAGN